MMPHITGRDQHGLKTTHPLPVSSKPHHAFHLDNLVLPADHLMLSFSLPAWTVTRISPKTLPWKEKNSIIKKKNPLPNGLQSLSNKTSQRTQTAMVLTAHRVWTAKFQPGPVPTDHLMDQLEPHLLERNQQLYHTITPTLLPEDHIKLPVILPHLIQHHQYQLKSFFNSVKNQLATRKPPSQSENQKRSQSLTQRLPNPTPLSTVKTTEIWWNKVIKWRNMIDVKVVSSTLTWWRNVFKSMYLRKLFRLWKLTV